MGKLLIGEIMGPQGPQGETGPQGERGEKGEPGDAPYISPDTGTWWIGDTDTGVQAQGEPGKDGADGVDGANGKDGKDGEPGRDGTDGAPGAPGAGLPPGGDAGQIPAKASADDYDIEWVDAPEGGGFNWRGDFILGNMYAKNDVVVGSDGVEYIARMDGLVLPPPNPGWEVHHPIYTTTWDNITGDPSDNAALVSLIQAGGTDLPWCSGYFQDRSLAANVVTTITPVYQEGRADLISGNSIIVPESGLYIYSIGCMYIITGTSPTITSIATRNGANFSYTLLANEYTIAPRTLILNLDAGDAIEEKVRSSLAASSINNSGLYTLSFYLEKLK